MVKNNAVFACYLLSSTLISISNSRATRGQRSFHKLTKREFASSEETPTLAIDFPETQIEQRAYLLPDPRTVCPDFTTTADIVELTNYPERFGQETCNGLDVPLVMSPAAAGEEYRVHDPLGRVRTFLDGLIEENSALGRCPSTMEVKILSGKAIGSSGECTVHLKHKICNCDEQRLETARM